MQYEEKLITAFMMNSKRADIMAAARIGKNKYYALKDDSEFQRIVTERRNELIKEAVLRMEGLMTENTERLQQIIRDPETAAQVKINALQLFFNQLGQWRTATEISERLRRLEDLQAQNSDRFRGE